MVQILGPKKEAQAPAKPKSEKGEKSKKAAEGDGAAKKPPRPKKPATPAVVAADVTVAALEPRNRAHRGRHDRECPLNGKPPQRGGSEQDSQRCRLSDLAFIDLQRFRGADPVIIIANFIHALHPQLNL